MNEEKNLEEKEKKSKKGIIFTLLFLLLLILASLVLNKFYGIGNLLKGGITEKLRDRNGAEIIEIEKKEIKKEGPVSEEGVSEMEEVEEMEEGEIIEGDMPEVAPEEEEGEVDLDVTITTSETRRKEVSEDGYTVHQISFGNSVVVGDDDIQGTDLNIESINAEVMESVTGDGVNAVITWVTTKSSVSELSYSKKDGGGGATMREGSYGISHAMFLEGLEDGEEYIFNIKVRSKNNQTAESGYESFEAKVEGESFFSTIGDTIKGLFGF